ncbi:MAG: arginine N-succinyltransferase, partial [Nitrococcus sp.]|nr:arginine N-succinyltransferase [Nitrococcus sp.]
MMIIRPIGPGDLQALEQLVEGTGIGLTSLPRERAALRQRIEHSRRSFARAPSEADEREERFYFFVLEESASARIVGTTAIKAGIGLSEPYYSYRLSTVVHAPPARRGCKNRTPPNLTNPVTGGA